MDDRLTARLNDLARRDPRVRMLLAQGARRLAAVEVGLMLLLVAAGRRGSAVRMLLAVGLVYVASEALGALWPRKRPFARVAGVESLVAHTAERSFPSRHVASGLAMAVIGGREHHKLGLVMAGVAWLLGITRIAAGLHYPSDVLAGAIVGITLGCYARDM